jgi:hypothetical protein
MVQLTMAGFSCDSLIEIVFKCMDYCAGAAKVWEGCGQLWQVQTQVRIGKRHMQHLHVRDLPLWRLRRELGNGQVCNMSVQI